MNIKCKQCNSGNIEQLNVNQVLYGNDISINTSYKCKDCGATFTVFSTLTESVNENYLLG